MTTEHLPGQMDVEDFIAKGLTRPLTEREIAEIHPQAVVDKTDVTPPPPEVSIGEHVATSHVCYNKTGGNTCDICFAPMTDEPHDEMPPTYEHEPDHGPVAEDAAQEPAAPSSYPYEEPMGENVEILDSNTKHDMPVELVLRQVFDAELVEIVVCGIDKDGHEYVVRSNADMAPAMWHLQRAIYTLNKQYEEMNAGEKA